MLAFLFNRYTEKQKKEHKMDNQYSAIQKYLLNENTTVKDLEKMDKPIMWIHIVNEYNSRMWESFGSRSSFHLNQPYMYLTVKSILAKCDESFHICLIDDNSFAMLLPNWRINTSILSNPILDNMRQLALAKILHTYGGFLVPPSFLCMKNLIDLYDRGTQNGNRMFVCETVDRNVTSTTHGMYPNTHFMGAPKHNHMMAELIEKIQHTISNDNTAQSVFLGDLNRFVAEQVARKKIYLVDGKLIGTKTIEDEPILIDDLLSNNYIKLYNNADGIYIPADEILNRRNYEWFARLSPAQVLESKMIISKYILVANIPGVKSGQIESYQNDNKKIVEDNVTYWRVPLQAPVYGLMPNGLGDRVLKNISGSEYFNG
jgi:hypothetical protein